ncbi:MAG: DUF456 domain-containing protein [Rikenellaceae bacterium]|nr:DUF456 domain-containing protein [Rikenellaceae bacterium]MDE7355669.1 DUF456 domain-containing protein [Rikenellaceae bacterium]
MDVFLIVLGLICVIVGLLGCLLPVLPGVTLSYVGLLLLHFSDRVQFTAQQLIVWLVIVVIIQVLDYIVPMLGSKYSGGTRWGTWGCFIGTIAGLFFLPWGIIAGPFIGAVGGELLGGKNTGQALKSGFGSLMGFLFGTVAKCAVCAYFAWKAFGAVFADKF